MQKFRSSCISNNIEYSIGIESCSSFIEFFYFQNVLENPQENELTGGPRRRPATAIMAPTIGHRRRCKTTDDGGSGHKCASSSGSPTTTTAIGHSSHSLAGGSHRFSVQSSSWRPPGRPEPTGSQSRLQPPLPVAAASEVMVFNRRNRRQQSGLLLATVLFFFCFSSVAAKGKA